jgi:hypothetical protein
MIRSESFLCICRANCIDHQQALRPLRRHNSATVAARLLDAIEVFTVFWGQVWQKSPNSDLANQINQFFSFVVSSALIDQLAEYSVPGQTIVHGSFIGTVNIAATWWKAGSCSRPAADP